MLELHFCRCRQSSRGWQCQRQPAAALPAAARQTSRWRFSWEDAQVDRCGSFRLGQKIALGGHPGHVWTNGCTCLPMRRGQLFWWWPEAPHPVKSAQMNGVCVCVQASACSWCGRQTQVCKCSHDDAPQLMQACAATHHDAVSAGSCG